MKVGSLFSGGGLGDFGFMAAGMEIAWQVEIDEYCQKILELRYPESKKYRDIKTLKGSDLEKVDIITGGFPCQDISIAGKHIGISGERSGLWSEMYRIVCEKKPKYVVVENVERLLGRGLNAVLWDLAEIGYDAEWMCLPAWIAGLPHTRKRVWIIGYPKDNRCKYTFNAEGVSLPEPRFFKKISVKGGAISNKERFYEQIRTSEFVRTANGIADRVHRLKMLGNGQVPACTYVIGKMIMDITANVVAESE